MSIDIAETWKFTWGIAACVGLIGQGSASPCVNQKLPGGCPGSFYNHVFLSPAPVCAVAGVLDGYAQFLQPVADQIGERPQFLLAHLAAHFHQQVDEPVRVQ